ncbi:MAG: Mut7-C RNAse domain-containing protein [Simkaniaceae bacterium]
MYCFDSEMEKKFLCDQMLARLGKYLRAAGYDTKIISKSMPDQEIAEIAEEENRVLITRDRHFSRYLKFKSCIIILAGNFLEDCVRELKNRICINWLHAPFTRCIRCNTKLQKEVSLDRVPAGVRKWCQEFWTCPRCLHIYWKGSHTDRMLNTLKKWNELF